MEAMEYYIIELEHQLANKLYQYNRYGGRRNQRKVIKLQNKIREAEGKLLKELRVKKIREL